MVIAVASQKGGSGKSTLLTALAGALASRVSVQVIDADPQRTTATWWELAKEQPALSSIELAEFAQPDLHRQVFDDEHAVLIDCPGRLDNILRSALMAADVLLVPLQPTHADAWALPLLAEQLAAAKKHRSGRPLRAAVVLNRVKPNTRLARGFDENAGNLPDGFELLRSRVRDLTDFQVALGEGTTPQLLKPRGNAAMDVAALAQEVQLLAGLGGRSRQRSSGVEALHG